VTSPAEIPHRRRGNKHLYHNCTLAIDADTGRIVVYQHVVDHWDLDHPFERLLVDTAVTRTQTKCDGSTPHQAG
jgi:alcohol dehydrogenase (cytochrome c)